MSDIRITDPNSESIQRAEDVRKRQESLVGQAEAETTQVDARGGELTADLLEGVATSERAGIELSAEAVKTADEQQDQGEKFAAFSDSKDAQQLPQSLEDLKEDERVREEAGQNAQSLRVQDVLNEMAIQQGMHKA